MSILSDDSLEFAKKHITKFYDSDFFPRAFEFDALWHSWGDVKKELTTKNVSKHWVTSPRTLTSMKPKGGFRVVQQLDPLDTIVYTALAYSVADKVEAARVPKDQHVACSYRIDLDNGSLFAEGNGFGEFTTQSEKLANEHKFVLATDITDFYNQIYLHRLNNAIEFAERELKPLGDDVEGFLSRLNGKASQGVPVGPAASIIMAEAVMMDIDEFLINKGVSHTRYVDDFRIFSETKELLLSVLEDLTLYLYENHRLTLSSDKTKIIESEKYINEILHNHYELERVEIFHTLEIFNPYSGESEEVEIPV
ncbi:RNA-directed DNA polymerase, partial [Vibrio cholerae]|nr:RNA-directed DNA polymerase [Vibrio cholerae]